MVTNMTLASTITGIEPLVKEVSKSNTLFINFIKVLYSDFICDM